MLKTMKKGFFEKKEPFQKKKKKLIKGNKK